MARIRIVLAAAGIAAAALAGTPANAVSSVCVNEPATHNVYRGCTYVDSTRPCVSGGGFILNSPYRLICRAL